MNILVKLKETALSVLPVAAIVLLMGLTVVPLEIGLLERFCLGAVLLVLGLTVFLIGVDIGISPVGERCGAALTARKSLALLLVAAFVIGFIVTAAEPDIQVFGDQVRDVFPRVDKKHLTFSIAGGVGLFISFGLLRIVTAFPFKLVMLLSYCVLALAAVFAPQAFVAIAFDSGGATTGPLTVPFIMALGLGVSSVRADRGGSFGLTGIASVGPILAVLLYSIFADVDTDVAAATEVADAAVAVSPLSHVITHAVVESATSIVPLYAMVLLFQLLLLKMSMRQMLRVTTGFAFAFFGLTVFLTGVNAGFMQAGKALGEALGAGVASHGGLWYAMMIGTGLAFGAIIVCAEPAVWVLSEQVESVSGGLVRRKALLVFLSAGTALAIALAMCRAVAGFGIAWILLPGYALAMLLMIFSPTLFSEIAFDSGGVASGPLTSTFVLSFTIGAASGGSGSSDSFGVIALVAMMPLVAIQIMGIVFESARRKASAKAGGGIR